MQYNVKTPAEYLDTIEPDWRLDKIEELRTIIQIIAPDLEEGINYKMLSYGNEQGIIFHLNAQKHFVGLYVGDAKKIDIDGTLLEGLDVGKGCIRIKKSINIGETKLAEFIEKAVDMWNRGEDTDC